MLQHLYMRLARPLFESTCFSLLISHPSRRLSPHSYIHQRGQDGWCSPPAPSLPSSTYTHTHTHTHTHTLPLSHSPIIPYSSHFTRVSIACSGCDGGVMIVLFVLAWCFSSKTYIIGSHFPPWHLILFESCCRHILDSGHFKTDISQHLVSVPWCVAVFCREGEMLFRKKERKKERKRALLPSGSTSF